MATTTKPNEIDLYIAQFPEQTQKQLTLLRTIIKKAAPNAQEVISYKMPAYHQLGMLVYFAGYKNHIGLYPTGSGIDAFKDVITDYKTSKGTIQFPLNKPLPKKLITDIVKFKIAMNELKNDTKKQAGVFSTLVKPAQRALAQQNIKTAAQLAKYSEAELLTLHGIGPSSIPKLKTILLSAGLTFKP